MATGDKHLKVLVVEDMLMTELVKGILAANPGLNVIGVNPTDTTTLIDSIQRIKPDVVVLDQSTNLALIPYIPESYKDYPDVRFLIVSAASDWAQVYETRRVYLGGSKDLASFIQES